MLNNRALFFMIGILLSFAVNAQENFQNGYIVLSKNDTVRGEIDYREWVASPRQIDFRDARTGKRTTYQPGELAAFFVSGDTYRSYLIHVAPYINDNLDLSDEDSAAPAYDTTGFLRLITGGKVSLYLYRDKTDLPYYFIQRQADAPEQLVIRTTMVERDGHRNFQQEDLYKYQLGRYLRDCPGIGDGKQRIDYTEKTLRKLVFTYNNCGKDTVEQKAGTASRKQSVFFMPILGFMHSRVSVKGQLYEAQMSWPAYNGPIGGAGMLVVLPRGREQYSFLFNALYNHFESHGNALNLGYGLNVRSTFDMSQAQLDVQFRYRYPEGKVRPFINFGLGELMEVSNKSTQEVNVQAPTPIFGDASYMHKTQTVLLGGAGVQAGRFSVEARIMETDGMMTIDGTGAHMTDLYLLCGFNF
jgi:hypothetical protein